MKKEEKIAKKRKERAKKSKAKILKIRENIRKERKEEKKKFLLEQSSKPKQNPILNMKKKNQTIDNKDEKIRDQLLQNQQILKALEEEYEKEQSNRQNLNSNLEDQGHGNLQDKLNAMHKQVVESNENLQNPDAPIQI